MPSPDKDRTAQTDLTTVKQEPGSQSRPRTKSVPDPTADSPTQVFRSRPQHPLSPERAAFREVLPALFQTMTINELAIRFNISSKQVRNDILYLQGRGLLPQKNAHKSTENLPYEQALERAIQFEKVVHNAVEANRDITLSEIIEALRSQLDWATEINPDAARIVLVRVKKELYPDSLPQKKNNKTT